MTPSQLVVAKEETEELGGYFIVNGNEKIIRLLVVGRRNYPMAIVRPSFRNRGPTYTRFGVQIRSVRPDQTSQTNVLHYLNDGNVNFRFSWRKNEYVVPVMLIMKALVEMGDRQIFEHIVGSVGVKGLEHRQFVMDRVEVMLETYRLYEVDGYVKTRSFLGSRFRGVLRAPRGMTNFDAGTLFLRRIVLPHLGAYNVTELQNTNKLEMLFFMTRKLYSLAEGECAPDNPDAVSNQEVLLGGFLYGMILKERIEELLDALRISALTWCKNSGWTPFTSEEFKRTIISKVMGKTNEDLGWPLQFFIATGNLVSRTGLDLQQTSGFTVVAEKINFYRFLSHFRMVHRGAFFAQLKTTSVRKLLPESWGFLCPVHTPDGAPCGLLNHLAHKCKIATRDSDVTSIPAIVAEFNCARIPAPLLSDSIVIQLDGRVLGYCSPEQAQKLHDSLRYWKVEGGHGVPADLEIGFVPLSNAGLYPGIYMFSQAARMYRPVKYLPLDKEDFVGPFEQPYMAIACTKPELLSADYTHIEHDPTNILSIVANQTPFSDYNQSPRNMYQCQMGKQSMGTPGTALKYRCDNKTYRLQTGQTPVVRPPLHNEYGLDNFPNGMNAVVAVISYTGYDMDDAMIINKSSHERGFGAGAIFKVKFVDIADPSRGPASKKNVTKLFGFAPRGEIKAEWKDQLDNDGWPKLGCALKEGSLLAAYHSVSYDYATGEYVNRDRVTQFVKYKDIETAFVEEVRVVGSEEGNQPCQSVSIRLRIPRSPFIGDKFSSRHGQKGVLSRRWPSIDMPFCESGIQPDVIINPHAFPSRMTIGMFVESMAGKAGVLHGVAQDSTPWKFDEKDTAIDYFGEQLRKSGYNYYGNEAMYSGITGEELAADIFIGVVYYQRLRHMVNDKYQVRTTGPNDDLTGQPVKGRAKGGGIRVGEMERDALLAHGAAFLLQDRLLNCSDYAKAWICRQCGRFLATTSAVPEYGRRRFSRRITRCKRCATKATGMESQSDIWRDGHGFHRVGGENVRLVAIPNVLRYLDVELAAMGMKLKFQVTP